MTSIFNRHPNPTKVVLFRALPVLILALLLTAIAFSSRMHAQIPILEFKTRVLIQESTIRADLFEHFVFGFSFTIIVSYAFLAILHVDPIAKSKLHIRWDWFTSPFVTPTFWRDAVVTTAVSALAILDCSISWEMAQVRGQGYPGQGPRAFQWDQCFTDISGMIVGLLLIFWVLKAAYPKQSPLGETPSPE